MREEIRSHTWACMRGGRIASRWRALVVLAREEGGADEVGQAGDHMVWREPDLGLVGRREGEGLGREEAAEAAKAQHEQERGRLELEVPDHPRADGIIEQRRVERVEDRLKDGELHLLLLAALVPLVPLVPLLPLLTALALLRRLRLLLLAHGRARAVLAHVRVRRLVLDVAERRLAPAAREAAADARRAAKVELPHEHRDGPPRDG